MTTTDTQDVIGTADQTERLADAGCEIVRITAPSIKDAVALAEIRSELDRRGVRVPLVADIHFTPNAAMEAALHVEKVRVNPGNYADKKRFEVHEYDDAEYAAEVGRVHERFRPLVLRCREMGRALRIGTNHGSLSDRIMNRFGDTPAGMVESALEFLDVCEEEEFQDVVFSMKSSNPQVAVQAYRLLAARLAERAGDPEAPSYPFHVGVTEAGDGDDGRIKSAIGIGALLEDGIGDTIRVSLTEDPVKEVPVARALASRYDSRESAAPRIPDPGAPFTADPFAHARRKTAALGDLGSDYPVRVVADLGPVPMDPEAAAAEIARALSTLGDVVCEGLAVAVADGADTARLARFLEALAAAGVDAPVHSITPPALVASLPAGVARTLLDVATEADVARAEAGRLWHLAQDGPALLAAVDAIVAAGRPAALCVSGERAVHATRAVAARLAARGFSDVPLLLRHRADPLAPEEGALLAAATDLGALLIDGIGDALLVGGFGSLGRDVALAYRILQGARLRTSWTEFISCPSCGRTLFDLEETTARVKAVTTHLPGLKIAVMGCIVNGPGEMADADFGYVGSGVGKVNLYVGHECVVRNVPEAQAPDRLVDLIREHGRWVDPPEA
jgi:(E)-4-hydroxy-3-methylbut-2-enyl-diphosphate synthase